jgi:iron complex outermembrane receptor protein
VPAQQLFVDIGWMPDRRAGPFAGAEIARIGRVQVDDRNSDSAEAATVINLRGGWRVDLEPWSLTLFARVDNLDDRRYFGSVIVNDGNGRYFEPAPGRTWLLGAQLAYRF